MLRKIINTFSSNLFIAILNLLIAIVVSQHLGAAGKGQQSIIITTIALILVLCNIAGGASLVYLVPRYDNFKILTPSYIWSILIALILYFFLLSFNDIPSKYVFHICLLSLVSSFTAINSMLLLGNERIKAKNFIAVLQTSIVIITLIYLFIVKENKSIESYILALYIGYVVSFLVSCVFILLYIKKRQNQNKSLSQLLKDMFKYGFLNQLGHITQLLSIRLSYYILLGFLGEEKVGIYSNAVSLAESVWLVSKSIAMVQYARIANSSDKNYSQWLTIKLLKSAFIVSFIIIIPLVFLPSTFYIKLFGSEFGSINKIIAILAPGILIYNFAIILGHYFSGNGQYHINTIGALIGLLISITSCLILIPIFSVYGAALATSISFFGMSLYIIYIFINKNNLSLTCFLISKEDIFEVRKLLNFFKKQSINE